MFNTQNFGIEAAANGQPFQSHETVDAALVLTAEPATLVPGETVAFEYQVKNVANGADSTVTLQQAQADDTMGGFLSTSVMTIEDGVTCEEGVDGGELAVGTGFFNLTGDQEADAQALCILVTLGEGDNPREEQNSTITWEFSAEQTEDAGTSA